LCSIPLDAVVHTVSLDQTQTESFDITQVNEINVNATWVLMDEFAKTNLNDSDRVIETVEKRRISEHCSTGLYYFKSANLYNQAYLRMHEAEKFSGFEYFIAPLYNYLIEINGMVLINKIENHDIRFCGTPAELKQTLIDLIKTL
jgi:hypothetical protein